MTKEKIKAIEEKIGYKFNEEHLLIQAFTRSSFASENQNYRDNEQLEFVGDKVLDFIVVKKLTEAFSYSGNIMVQSLSSIENGEPVSKDNIVDARMYEFVRTEGELTEIKKQIVQTSFLSSAIERLELEKYLIMGKGDIKNNVQNEPHVKEDLLEAIIGAVAIDSSWNIPVIESLIEKVLNLEYHIKNGIDDGVDYITFVQDWHRKKFKSDPEYNYFNDKNGDLFMCELKFKGFGYDTFEGVAYSKKEAAKMAAKRACIFLLEVYDRSQQIFEVIGKFSLDDAINKLQMLQDKKLVSGLEYIFREQAPTAESNGNPNWFCRCKINEIDNFVEYGNPKKILAKKAAAFTVLSILTEGRDRLLGHFMEEGEIK